MKYMYKLLSAAIIATSLIFTSSAIALPFSKSSLAGPALPTKPVKRIVIWDIDDVLIRLNKGVIMRQVLGYAAYGAPHKLSLFKYGISKAMGFQKPVGKTSETVGTFIPEGPTYSIAKHLKLIPYGDEYFSRICRIVNEQRTYVMGMKEILEDLITQDDVLVVAATNKDARAFRETAGKLGLEKYFHLVCTSDTDPAGDLLPEKFKKALGTEVIRSSDSFEYTDRKPVHKHIAYRKPALGYFNEVTALTKDFMKANGLAPETVESISFIDDKQENLNGFRDSLDKTPFKEMEPQPAIQTFKFDKKKEGAEGLLKSGILSVNTQHTIMNKITLNKRYNRWGGSFLQVWDKLRMMIAAGPSQ